MRGAAVTNNSSPFTLPSPPALPSLPAKRNRGGLRRPLPPALATVLFSVLLWLPSRVIKSSTTHPPSLSPAALVPFFSWVADSRPCRLPCGSCARNATNAPLPACCDGRSDVSLGFCCRALGSRCPAPPSPPPALQPADRASSRCCLNSRPVSPPLPLASGFFGKSVASPLFPSSLSRFLRERSSISDKLGGR